MPDFLLKAFSGLSFWHENNKKDRHTKMAAITILLDFRSFMVYLIQWFVKSS